MTVTENVSLVSTSISFEILKVNFILGFSIGILFNLLLIFSILKRSPTSLRAFQPIFLIAAITDGQLIVLGGFTQVKRQTINSINFIVFDGPANLLPEIAQWFVYALMVSSYTFEVLVLLFKNVFRYWFLKTRNSLTTNQLVGSILIIFFLCFGQIPVALFGYIQSAERRCDYNIWWPEHDVVIISDYKNDMFVRLLGLYHTSMSSGVFVLAILIAALSVWEMKKNVSSMSNKTKDLLNQYTNMLVTRVIVFAVTNAVPLLIIQFTSFFTINSSVPDCSSTILFTWLPIMNTLITLIFIRPYRVVLLKNLRRGWKVLTFQSFNEITVIKVQVVGN